MGNTVYAEKMGFFHQASGGKGVAPGDVCLSPPPPPAGPVPVPYVNMLSASDLIKGSKSVKVQGTPTALENSSEVALSTGNEAATPGLGAGVVTHRIKGKGVFKLWSFTVKAEGKGVDRHGDMMAQNTASDLPNCIDGQAMVDFEAELGENYGKPCKSKYKASVHRPKRDPSPAQVKEVKDKPCWECERDHGETEAAWRTQSDESKGAGGWLRGKLFVKLKKVRKHGTKHSRGKGHMTHDHQPPLAVAWEMGGCHMGAEKFRKRFEKDDVVKSHCKAHYKSQGSQVDEYAKKLRAQFKAAA
ncbi:MAG: DUF4150 domain-containing protein [Mesorhizobium sp.]|uniref:Tox-PAAR-like domain-containing protein n=1 Tax=Mesorhizobium mediterraneum TaxID=43617 RepID=A0AB36R6S9_9HYPH|nr:MULTISPECIES: DUF4150 domain-containing protein [Mesorhizobium]RUU39405.1 DUF4150 domain-containing protein [Mesorhizobium sp. M6A.T.Ca.TU.002.02.2.1]AZO63657.1 DUF4150 domain-containing protein [Mesorhizobium sp. M6A.T.Cr.TU.016.01.1.1]PAQ00289.1 hypothetical protein CIT25_20980 [Mesorhizobium mediterraneum]RUU31545.1 DUF4150 domain-containing protein [Mesorhizobium sp. M6A.T.Ce.TU.016.01.1.1]RUU46813.1 DUF4150 domain-containing protein [Mesorhizobium sp. M6A.T.Ce.TU.002.03.1.1]